MNISWRLTWDDLSKMTRKTLLFKNCDKITLVFVEYLLNNVYSSKSFLNAKSLLFSPKNVDVILQITWPGHMVTQSLGTKLGDLVADPASITIIHVSELWNSIGYLTADAIYFSLNIFLRTCFYFMYIESKLFIQVISTIDLSF